MSTKLEVLRQEPFAQGHQFGAAGAYERIDGLLHFAIDPADPSDPALARIVDLDRAARGADGLVHFTSDLCLLQPVDPARASGTLLLEVPNRGRKGALGRFNRPAPPGQAISGTGGIAVGDGLLLSLGWTVAWIGWQWDVVREPAAGGPVGFQAPEAVDETGEPIQGQVMLEWQLNAPAADKLLADRVHHPYAAADVDEPAAMLMTRAAPGAPHSIVPREEWRFARDDGGTPVPDDTHVWLQGGFHPGVIYDLVYTTRTCPVVGTGMLALRDGVSFLRHGTAEDRNPCAGRLRHTLAYGSSQCGRLLRHFMHLDLNRDAAGRRAYDGLLVHVAGARRGEFNHRYAQPSVITIESFGFQPPFRFEGWQEDTKVITTNSSSEYWNREASLLHVADTGTQDLPEPEQVRLYHFAGTKHGPGALQPEEGEEADPPGARHRRNVVDYSPLIRAALFHLEGWVADGTEPPPSCIPRVADGTAIPPEDALAAYRAIPGVAVPDPDRLFRRRPLDLGKDAEHGVGRFPVRHTGEPYRWLVPALDPDGNEVAGIRPPDVAVPVATHTGWWARTPGTGGEGQNVDMIGSTIPFARDETERKRREDPRPSIAERYASRDDYEARVRQAAEALVEQRYLLPEDVDLSVRLAMDRYDAFAGTS